MFSGIVQGTAEVISTQHHDNFMKLILQLPPGHTNALSTGASIAVNGVCLTVTAFDERHVHFDLIMETLRVTNLGKLHPGSLVNFERAARFGDEIGGHPMSGHVHACAAVRKIQTPDNNRIIWIEKPAHLAPYIFPKGFIGLNGCSLTIGEVQDDCFNVFLIPETLAVTIFSDIAENDLINIEIDSQTQAIVDTVQRFMSAQQGV
ncbi:riboflavin synthase subunit alpha [Nitrincola alkalilacustris]|uniref:riboflavin synthase subunit alpha n=1 Tax=Nitrincola alkalilacustris TaxID=1571224 RepID=UPI00124D03D8|nr:riboflavin synthase subunit alpha [Nitrincola alkalilacustris]